MDNLEPITRNEMFLNGDDLEPITREEMILAGADLEPLTRHEWFLKKYRGGGDVTIKRLNVTQNGTYSESGKAYSPVVVNVPTPPVPENAYLLNSLSGLPADIASFNDGTDLPMASLKVTVTPYQDLSHGDPSPGNICPIIGWDEAVVTVADDAESPTTSHEYTIDLDGTRYGGTLDVVSGVLTVDRASIKLSDLIWTKQNTVNNNWRFKSSESIQNIKIPTSAAYKIDNLCSVYRNVTANETWTADDTGIAINADASLLICDLNQADTTALGVVIANQTICYELATPITVQLAPQPVKSLEGVNKIFANCGQITEGKYFKRA